MQVTMNYGRKGLTLNLPDDWEVTVINKKAMPVAPDPEAAVREALANPVGCPPLTELAKGKKSACILICDITRPVPNGLILPHLVRQLMEAGMAQERITILVATGLHRPNEGEELREIVGDDWVMDNIRVENHFARNDADHADLGTTPRGTRVKLDRRLVEAEVRIAVGLVEPHFMAGYSGGRKIIMPGVAHKDTITFLHTASFFEHPKSANCNLEGNPLHTEQLNVVETLGGAYAVNAVIDEHRRLSFINFGEIVESHYQAVEYVRPYAEVYVPGEKYETVITSSAGYPLDKTYYQTVKGMVGAQEILKRGGDLFIVSEISEGFGSPEYLEAQKRLIALGVDGFLADIIPKNHADIDEWQTEMQLKPMRIGNIYLYTEGLTPEERALTGVEVIGDLEASILKSAGEHKRVAVIPEGPYIIPFQETCD
jgi:nickel-dependent lactate racemase